MTTSRYRTIIAALLLGAFVTSGCGGKYTDAERLQAAASVGASPSGQTAAAENTPRSVGAGVDDASHGAAAAPSVSAASGSAPVVGATAATGPATAGRPGATGANTGPASMPAGVAPVAAAARPGSPSTAQPAAGGVTPGPGVAATGPKPPIKLGEIIVGSGVLANIFGPYHEGAIAWVNDVNRRGGLAGHSVDLITVDDGGDPRKAVALVKRLVEQDKVTALYAHSSPGTTDAIMPYLEEKGIAMIGSDAGNTAHENSPIYFNTTVSSVVGLMWSHLLPLLTFHPEIKEIGMLYCTEIPACKALNDALARVAPPLGYKIVYSAAVTVAQPDYTAEVLAARGAGAKAVLLAVDNFSAIRVASSAHRQNYNPVFAIQLSAHAEDFLKQGGAEIEGFVVGGTALHWDNPLNADFRAAYRAYVPGGRGYTDFALINWNAGKLLELVAPTWPATPDPADIIASLRSLRGETVGGRLPPTTFTPGQPAGTYCGTTFTVKSATFVAFEGKDQWRCPPGYTPGA